MTDMTRAEREAFLAEVRVGVVAIARDDRAPIAVPIWYNYVPGGDLGLWMEAHTAKAHWLRRHERFTFVVQDDTRRPYRYVSVSGPVISMAPIDMTRELEPLVHRYLDQQAAEDYLADMRGPGGLDGNLYVRMRPEHWRAEIL